MPQSTRRTFATGTILVILVNGLVVAQKYTGYQGNCDSQLSKEVHMAKEISSLDSMDEFPGFVKSPLHRSRRMGENEERSNAERPTPARCMPELQVVSLKLETDPSSIYYPSCTRIRRCGGCCSHSLLSCQPTATLIRNFEVLVLSGGDSDEINYRNKQIVPLEEHTKCMCDCIIKAKDCNSTQSYVQDECRCM